LPGKPVNGSGNGARSGAQTLLLLAAPLSGFVLRALADGPKQLSELQRLADFPAQTTLRAQLKRLVESGAVAKNRRNRFPGVLEYELTDGGLDLLFAAGVLESWLAKSSGGPLSLGGGAAKASIKALAEGWSTTMLRALAASPLTLTQLDGLISSLSYPALERRLSALRIAGLVEPLPGNGRGTPHRVTTWAREGVAPLAAAVRWEQSHLGENAAPIGRLDAEAAFLLTVPMLRLPDETAGSCRLVVETHNGRAVMPAGVTVAVEDGRVASCVTRLQRDADAWAIGPPDAWLSALIEENIDRLELGGRRRFARLLIERLQGQLFANPIGNMFGP
jgi:DNA-binding HxlR family transcriptional regulator